MSEIEIEGLTIISGIEKIQEGELFRSLSFDETRMLADICSLVDVHDGDIVIEENSIGRALYLVVDGEVEVFKGQGEDRKEIAVLRPGELFGEMSLIEDRLTSTSVSSRGNTRLLRVDKLKLEQLMEKNDRLAAKINRSFCVVLSERLRKANQKLKEVDVNG